MIYAVYVKYVNVGMTFNKEEAQRWLGRADAHRGNFIEARKFRAAEGIKVNTL